MWGRGWWVEREVVVVVVVVVVERVRLVGWWGGQRLSVRGECTTAAVDPRLLRGQYKEEHLGLPIVSAARNGFNLLVCAVLASKRMRSV